MLVMAPEYQIPQVSSTAKHTADVLASVEVFEAPLCRIGNLPGQNLCEKNTLLIGDLRFHTQDQRKRPAQKNPTLTCAVAGKKWSLICAQSPMAYTFCNGSGSSPAEGALRICNC